MKLRGIGDVVLSTVIFDALKENFPGAQIDFLTEKPGALALENVPLIKEVLIFNRKSKKQRFGLFFEVRKRKYDLVIDLFSNPATAQLTFFSGARYRAGFPYKGRKYGYNLYGPPERDKYHAAQLHLELLKTIGIEVKQNYSLYFGLNDNAISFANHIITKSNLDGSLLLGISPSGGWDSKKCDPVKFAEIADNVIDKYNTKTIIVWGPGDENDAGQIKKMMKHDAVLAPPSNLLEMGALIQKCDFLIANDSGPMHISTAVGTPVLSLHGPTSPYLQGPFGEKHEWVRLDDLDCIQCNLLECPKHHECFLQLPVERVMQKVDNLLRKNNLIR